MDIFGRVFDLFLTQFSMDFEGYMGKVIVLNEMEVLVTSTK